MCPALNLHPRTLTEVISTKALLIVLTVATIATAILCVVMVRGVQADVVELTAELARLSSRVEELQDWWQIDRTNQNAKIEALELYIERVLDNHD